MRLAVLGGSYNPIHLGHLMLADAVSLRYGYDTVAFIPAFLSPFKDGHSGCTAEDRLAMVKLAIADNPAFYCEPCEIQRQGVSYTIDTLKFLKKKFPQCEGKIGLIIGDDLLEGFTGWREAVHIPDYADIIVGNRIIDRYSTEQADTAGKIPHLRVDNALLPVSSSGIRAAIQEKKSWRYLVPSAVYSYIKEHKLYE
ncbi:nicotinate (nicotinamide) nucleotide adenylyltransferase [Treponema sp. OMZ 855]|uniref:nicotinate (nicotinamide) nucleotide adenylyltransferase n=1 Tax=Treponema sp. OMZ 855 TaxID=1643512 RepID=UPI0020A3996D|nr:nicotinate (nicotinamide) nucleotide adenylyltransferase [Treponema sp. OMZ 855]UTC50110.1 nicotinate (nicotinamide) nucleotide adenylyltransferase [Treponema sp. OMZ 855]